MSGQNVEVELWRNSQLRGLRKDGLEEEIVIENGVPSVLITKKRCKRNGISARFAESLDDEREVFGCKTVPTIC
jgi:hypothetical protein